MKRSWMARTGVAAVLACALGLPAMRAAASADLPAQLGDKDYWKLVSDFSEANGYFRSDNLLSNEIWFQYIVPELVGYLKPGGVYLGVGPEQNFTYIAALKPRMVFIIDIRRGNMHTQLMYKALFELSADRADFVSMLFSRKRPEGLTASSTVAGDLHGGLGRPVHGRDLQGELQEARRPPDEEAQPAAPERRRRRHRIRLLASSTRTGHQSPTTRARAAAAAAA